MSVITLEGVVEDGRIRLTDSSILPEKTRVYVIVPDAPPMRPRIWSPRLADPSQIDDFAIEVCESPGGDSDGEL